MTALFDTNILIDYLKGHPAADLEIARYSRRLISAVTWMELLVGATGAEEEEVIEMFLHDFTVVPVDRAVARAAVEVRRRDRVRLPDAIIRASAEVESALLVTRNTKDFPSDQPGVRMPY